jgi:hypothetical protein
MKFTNTRKLKMLSKLAQFFGLSKPVETKQEVVAPVEAPVAETKPAAKKAAAPKAPAKPRAPRTPKK